jgi:hypothetical protein
MLSTTYKILYKMFVSKLTAYVDEMIGDHHCEVRRNRSAIDQIFGTLLMLRTNGNTLG